VKDFPGIADELEKRLAEWGSEDEESEDGPKKGLPEKKKKKLLDPKTWDAWIKENATKIGYEISFTRHFYQPQPLRTLDEIRADILAEEKEAEGLLDEFLKGGVK